MNNKPDKSDNLDSENIEANNKKLKVQQLAKNIAKSILKVELKIKTKLNIK